jgi:hypothetical protein
MSRSRRAAENAHVWAGRRKHALESETRAVLRNNDLVILDMALVVFAATFRVAPE